VGLKSLKSLNLTNGYPNNNNNNNNNNKVKSKPLELRSRVKIQKFKKKSLKFFFQFFFGYQRTAANLGHACEIFGGLGPLVVCLFVLTRPGGTHDRCFQPVTRFLPSLGQNPPRGPIKPRITQMAYVFDPFLTMRSTPG
jgi:hypothetical protein